MCSLHFVEKKKEDRKSSYSDPVQLLLRSNSPSVSNLSTTSCDDQRNSSESFNRDSASNKSTREYLITIDPMFGNELIYDFCRQHRFPESHNVVRQNNVNIFPYFKARKIILSFPRVTRSK